MDTEVTGAERAMAAVLATSSPRDAADVTARVACEIGGYAAALLTIAVPEGTLTGWHGLSEVERAHFAGSETKGSMLERRHNRARIRAGAYPGTAIAFVRDAIGPYNVLATHHERAVEGSWRADDTLYVLVRGAEGEDIGVLSLDAPLDGNAPDPSDLRRLRAVEAFLERAGPLLEARLLRARLQGEHALDLETHRDHLVARVAVEVAHDVNNLLTVVIATASFVADEPDRSGAVPAAMNEIISASETISNLCYRLLNAGRPVQTELQLIQPAAVVLENQQLFERLMPPGVVLELDLAPRAIAVRADSGHILQILLNLVVNARDAQPTARVRIATATRMENGVSFAVLEISDDGCGMSAEVRARIFERYFTTRPEGHGVGLATVKRLVDRLDGRIRVDSEPGVGTSIRVELPLRGSSAAACA